MTNVLIIGDSGTGKSTWLYRLKGIEFSSSYMTTIGKDTHIIKIGERKVILHDMGGQERYGSITKTYYDIADGAMIFYDVQDDNSKKRVEYWKNKLKKYTPILIIANKSDAVHECTDYIDFLISCKVDDNVQWPLEELLKDIPISIEETTVLERLLDVFYQYYIHYYNRLLT